MGDDGRESALSWVQSLESPGSQFALGSIIGYGDSAIVHEATDSGKKLYFYNSSPTIKM